MTAPQHTLWSQCGRSCLPSCRLWMSPIPSCLWPLVDVHSSMEMLRHKNMWNAAPLPPPQLVSILVVEEAVRQVCPLGLQANPVCPHSERANLKPSFCFANMPLETGSLRKTHHRNPSAADFHLTKLKCECLLQKMAGNLFVVISWRGSRKPKPSFPCLAASSIFCGSSSCQIPATNC